MNQLLGLLDSLEASLLEGKKIPLTRMTIIHEKELLSLVDKMRLVLKSNGRGARMAVEQGQQGDSQAEENDDNGGTSGESSPVDRQGYSDKITTGANDYAENVLANLQLMLTKMQKEIVRLERSVESGRKVLDQQKDQHKEELEFHNDSQQP